MINDANRAREFFLAVSILLSASLCLSGEVAPVPTKIVPGLRALVSLTRNDAESAKISKPDAPPTGAEYIDREKLPTAWCEFQIDAEPAKAGKPDAPPAGPVYFDRKSPTAWLAEPARTIKPYGSPIGSLPSDGKLPTEWWEFQKKLTEFAISQGIERGAIGDVQRELITLDLKTGKKIASSKYWASAYLAGRALDVEVNNSTFVVIILESQSCMAPGWDSQRVLLFSADGKLLDSIDCGINNSYGSISTDIPLNGVAEDKAKIVVKFKGRDLFNEREKFKAKLYYHDITVGNYIYHFDDENLIEPDSAKGICRIEIVGDKLLLLSPKPHEAKEVKDVVPEKPKE